MGAPDRARLAKASEQWASTTLCTDLADALDGAGEAGVLAKPKGRVRRFDMRFGIDRAPTTELEEPDLAFGEHAASPGALLLQPEQAVDAQGESMALPDRAHGRHRSGGAGR